VEEDFIDLRSPTGLTRLQLDAGPNHLDGETALMYVRQRHGSGDFNRARRQQQVAFALRSRLLSPDVLPRVPQLYVEMQAAVQTDFTPLDVPALLQAGASIRAENIRGRLVDETLTAFATTPDGKSVLAFDKAAVRAAVEEMFNAPPLEDATIICP
jgi:anionic cell wall polymer biosynthesis LytR-Cps2A-Psr (LCP) family protein